MASFQSPRRRSIRETSSIFTTSPRWKESLKAKCLERARAKRRNTTSKKRMNIAPTSSAPGLGSNQSMSAGSYGAAFSSPKLMDNNAISPKDTARQLVQEQLEETGVSVMNNFLCSTPNPKESCDATTITTINSAMPNINAKGTTFHLSPLSHLPNSSLLSPSNRGETNVPSTPQIQVPLSPFTTVSNNNSNNSAFAQQSIINSNTNQRVGGHLDGMREENWISEEELYELMQEVEEELRLEQEAQLQVEIDAMEAQEERDSNFIKEQIDIFESTAATTNLTCNDNCHSNMSICNEESVVPCPLCQVGNLIRDPASGSIVCQYYSSNNSVATAFSKRCNLCLDSANAKTVSFHQLRDKLSQAYQEHSLQCMGELRFELLRNCHNSENMLVAGCNLCGKRAHII